MCDHFLNTTLNHHRTKRVHFLDVSPGLPLSGNLRTEARTATTPCRHHLHLKTNGTVLSTAHQRESDLVQPRTIDLTVLLRARQCKLGGVLSPTQLPQETILPTDFRRFVT
jgi:hypothetical protein